MDYSYFFMLIRKNIKYIVAPISFCLMVLGIWFWQDREQPLLRVVGLLFMVISVYLYRKYLKL
jgi:hypothetical protein